MPWRRIWSLKAPHMVAFFAWVPTFDKILTVDNLWKLYLINDCWLVLHLQEWWIDFCLPSFTLFLGNNVWSFVFTLFGISWVMPEMLTCGPLCLLYLEFYMVLNGLYMYLLRSLYEWFTVLSSIPVNFFSRVYTL